MYYYYIISIYVCSGNRSPSGEGLIDPHHYFQLKTKQSAKFGSIRMNV